MLTGPIPATTKVRERAKMTLDQIDLVEINEAFAPVVLSWEKEHHPDMSKVNVNGGAIALGHPLGASGTRPMAPLLNEHESHGGRHDWHTMCVGGGVPTTVRVNTCSGQRAAKWRAMVPPSVAAMRCKRSMPSGFIRPR